MLEIPESKTIGLQADEELTGKTVVEVIDATSPHKFAFYNGAPTMYSKLLEGKQIQSAKGHGMHVDLYFDSNITLSLGDGTIIRYCNPLDARPKKHQLLLVFDDASFLVFTVAMYGCIFAFEGGFDNKYYQGSLNSLSPLEDAFDESYFDKIFSGVKKKTISVKALLATEQRIPGLGNGVLQDILFNASLHPKKKISEITDFQKQDLFHSLKTTLQSMTDKGGRDTEKDLYGKNGGYKTLLSKNTYKDGCPNCGGEIVKEAYLGGSVYYCSHCQK